MSELLEKINKPNDIKNIDKKDYPKLAEEIREFLIDSVSKTGGHLASNLGTVDLTIALHAVHRNYLLRCMNRHREQELRVQVQTWVLRVPEMQMMML